MVIGIHVAIIFPSFQLVIAIIHLLVAFEEDTLDSRWHVVNVHALILG